MTWEVKMLRRILLVSGGFFILCALGAYPAEAGFADVLKNIQKVLQGGKALSQEDIIQGLREALEIGAANAVKTVSAIDGYYKNPRIKIPLPENVQKVKKLLTKAGLVSQVREFELNAKRILNGADNEATLYFKDKTFNQLEKTFRPITGKAMTEVGVTRHYQKINIPFLDSLSFDLDQYVTEKALDGLFLILAEEEKKIRQDPAARVTNILQKVFGKN
jgi:hypothetical protein